MRAIITTVDQVKEGDEFTLNGIPFIKLAGAPVVRKNKKLYSHFAKNIKSGKIFLFKSGIDIILTKKCTNEKAENKI